MKKRIFIVYTPYQLIASLNIITQSDGDNLIVLTHPNLKGYMDICQHIQRTRVVFEENFVKQYRTYSTFIMHFNIVSDIFTIKNKAKRIGYLNEKIDELYVPSDEVICRVVFHKLRMHNAFLDLIVYDDGLGTYIGHMFRDNILLGNLVYGLFLDGDFSSRISRVYSYKPELVVNIPAFVDLRQLICAPSIMNIFKDYCGDKVKVYGDKKIVFLDQGMGHDATIMECVEIIKKHFEKSDIVVKMHPRIDSDAYDGLIKSNDGLPFEILAMVFDFSNCILITHSSGGCINPFLMFNQQLNVITLVDVNNDKVGKDKCSCFFDRVNRMIGETYIQKPKTVKEFEQRLIRLKEKIM